MSTIPPPVKEEKKPGSALAWILGLIGIGIVALTVLGLAVTYFVIYPNVQVAKSGNEVAITTPVGSMRVTKDGADDPGLPVFPDAKVADTGATVELAAPDGEMVAITAAKYRTNQSLTAVDDWYRDRLGPGYKREAAGVMVEKKKIFGADVRSDDIAYVYEKDDELHVVGLRKSGLNVEICLVRIGPKAAQ